MQLIRKKSTFIVALILGCVFILFGYQNCGKVNFAHPVDSIIVTPAGLPTLNGPAGGSVGEALEYQLINVNPSWNNQSTNWASQGGVFNVGSGTNNDSANMPDPNQPATISYSTPGVYTVTVSVPSENDFSASKEVVICEVNQVIVNNACVDVSCTDPFTNQPILVGQTVTSYSSGGGTCQSSCPAPVVSTCKSNGNSALGVFDPPVEAFANCVNPTAASCNQSCSLHFSDGTTSMLASGQTYPNPVYSSATVPTGSSCTGFSVRCDNGIIHDISVNPIVVAPSPLFKSCCSQVDLNQTLQAMTVALTPTNMQISAACTDPQFDSLFLGCSASFSTQQESFLSITYSDAPTCTNAYAAKTPSGFYTESQTRFINTCGNRYCQGLTAPSGQKYAAGFVTGGMAVSSPASITNTPSNFSAKANVNCIDQYPSPQAPGACQAIVNQTPIIVNLSPTYSQLQSVGCGAYDGTLTYMNNCGTKYCQSLKNPDGSSQHFVNGRVTELLISGNKSVVECFRDSTSYNNLFH